MRGLDVVLALFEARFIRRISVASNAIQTIDNETAYLIVCCLNCIRCDGISTYKTGLRETLNYVFLRIREKVMHFKSLEMVFRKYSFM